MNIIRPFLHKINTNVFYIVISLSDPLVVVLGYFPKWRSWSFKNFFVIFNKYTKLLKSKHMSTYPAVVAWR